MQRTPQRLAALALSALFTLVLLAVTNQLATSPPPATRVAQITPAVQPG